MRIDRRILALALVAACQERDPLSPVANALIVHAVLDAGAQQQFVFVQSTTGSPRYTRTVAGATVTITLPDGRAVTAAEVRDTTQFIGTFLAQNDTRSVYRFTVGEQGFSIVPGGTYALRVQTSDGRVVTGRTTIPDGVAVPIAAASERFSLSRDSLALAWTRVAGARSYEVAVSPIPKQSSRAFLTRATFADTAITLHGDSEDLGGTQLFFAGQGQRFWIVVSAVDANYYDYYRRESDPFSGGGLIGHLDGAEGVFGSMVAIRVRLLDVF